MGRVKVSLKRSIPPYLPTNTVHMSINYQAASIFANAFNICYNDIIIVSVMLENKIARMLRVEYGVPKLSTLATKP